MRTKRGRQKKKRMEKSQDANAEHRIHRTTLPADISDENRVASESIKIPIVADDSVKTQAIFQTAKAF
jgi:hypothetical protein